MKTHKDLFDWQKAMDMVESVYEITENIPKADLPFICDSSLLTTYY